MAVPMSLGIAIASGFPPMAGVVTAIIGGLVISFFSTSAVAIKGPAGGLSAIMLACVLALGQNHPAAGYTLALGVVVVAGFIQVLMGMLKMGGIAAFFPASTIHGMLAALGLALAVKQVHLALGVVPSSTGFWPLLAELPHSIEELDPKSLMISILTLFIMIGMSYAPSKIIKAIPSPLIVLAFVVPLGYIWNLSVLHEYEIGKKVFTSTPEMALLQLPENIWAGFVFPDFSAYNTFEFWEYAILLALAATIETLVSAKAIDKLDPQKRYTKPNADLVALGAGNILCGFIGGLPMICESKRSVININNGAQTAMSNFFHGAFVLVMVWAGVGLLKNIPSAALAAMLVYTGAKMATPSELSKSYKIGFEQFTVFLTTLLVTLSFNFIWGLIAGMAMEWIIQMRFGIKFISLIKPNIKVYKNSESQYDVRFLGPAVFSNYPFIQAKLKQIPLSAAVNFDFTKATLIDHTFMEHLQHYEEHKSIYQGSISLSGLDYHKHLSDHPLASKRIVKSALNDRQMLLKTLAEEKGCSFDFRAGVPSDILSHFNWGSGMYVKNEQNRTQVLINDMLVTVSDVHIATKDTTIPVHLKQAYDITLLYFKASLPIPNFTLHKEGFVDTLLALTGFNDIDFDDFPAFSYYYLLKGKHEDKVREFFTPALLRFFESNKGYHVECADNYVIIYKRKGLLEPDDVHLMIQFAQHFTETAMAHSSNYA